MFRPLLVDIGLSLEDIGWLLGIVPTSARVIGGIIAGFLIAPLGRKRALVIFSLISVLTTLTYFLPAFGVISLPVLYLTTISTAFTISMMNTATLTVQMDKSSLEAPGTDYSIQSSIGVFGSIAAASISGFIAKASGYRGVFGISLVIAITCFILIVKAFPNNTLVQQTK